MFLVIKKDSVKSISAFYTVFLAFATPIILYFNVVFKLLPYVALALWYAAFPRVQKASQRLPPAGGKTLQAFCFQKCSTSISSSQARPSSYCFRREGIPQVLKDGGHLRCQRVWVEVRLGQVALEVLDEPADGERRQRVGKFRAVRHGAAVGAHAPAGTST